MKDLNSHLQITPRTINDLFEQTKDTYESIKSDNPYGYTYKITNLDSDVTYNLNVLFNVSLRQEISNKILNKNIDFEQKKIKTLEITSPDYTLQENNYPELFNETNKQLKKLERQFEITKKSTSFKGDIYSSLFVKNVPVSNHISLGDLNRSLGNMEMITEFLDICITEYEKPMNIIKQNAFDVVNMKSY